MYPTTLADYGVDEIAATAEHVALGYAEAVGDPLWIDAATGALIG